MFEKVFKKNCRIVCSLVCTLIFSLLIAPVSFAANLQEGSFTESSNGGEKSSNSLAPKAQSELSLMFSTNVEVDLKTRKVKLSVGNPESSNKDISIKLIVDGELVMESSKIPPGYKIISGSLLDSVNLENDTYKGKILLVNYSRETGAKSMMNIEIPSKITVLR